MSDRVRITDVAPRDGLQNEPGFVPTAEKAQLVRAIASCGVDEVEITSFVSPKWIPQLGDASELCERLASGKPEGLLYSALVPNERGLEDVLAVNDRAGFRLIDKVSVFTAASETFSLRNTNASIEQAIERFAPVIDRARRSGLATRGYVSCAVACPFEGPIDPWATAAVAGKLAALGVEEIDLADTIGAGTPETIGCMLSTALQYLDEAHQWPDASRVTLHLHDTLGKAAESVRVALELGVRSFDAAAGGLGGCPYAGTPDRRAPGNLSMARLLDALGAAGMTHGVDRSRLDAAAAEALRIVGAARGVAREAAT